MARILLLNRLSKLVTLGLTSLSLTWAVPARADRAEIVPEIISPLQVPSLEEPGIYLPKVPSRTYLVLRLQERKVYVFQDGELRASYPVAIGKEGWETPTGEFRVLQMIENPSWEHPWTGEVVPPGEENPLGQRWVGFWTDGTNSIGFHGTPDESVMGKAVSHGCVRMRNTDIAELYQWVRLGTKVVVEP